MNGDELNERIRRVERLRQELPELIDLSGELHQDARRAIRHAQQLRERTQRIVNASRRIRSRLPGGPPGGNVGTDSNTPDVQQ